MPGGNPKAESASLVTIEMTLRYALIEEIILIKAKGATGARHRAADASDSGSFCDRQQ